jgi:hypothetical protein
VSNSSHEHVRWTRSARARREHSLARGMRKGSMGQMRGRARASGRAVFARGSVFGEGEHLCTGGRGRARSMRRSER